MYIFEVPRIQFFIGIYIKKFRPNFSFTFFHYHFRINFKMTIIWIFIVTISIFFQRRFKYLVNFFVISIFDSQFVFIFHQISLALAINSMYIRTKFFFRRLLIRRKSFSFIAYTQAHSISTGVNTIYLVLLHSKRIKFATFWSKYQR